MNSFYLHWEGSLSPGRPEGQYVIFKSWPQSITREGCILHPSFLRVSRLKLHRVEIFLPKITPIELKSNSDQVELLIASLFAASQVHF